VGSSAHVNVNVNAGPATPKTPTPRASSASAFSFASSPCESSLYQSNEMEDYDGTEEIPNCSEGPPASLRRAGSSGSVSVSVSHKIQSFQKDSNPNNHNNHNTASSSSSLSSIGRASPPPPPPPEAGAESQPAPMNKFKSWNQWEQKNLGLSNRSLGGTINGNGNGSGTINRGGLVISPSPKALNRPSVVVPRSPTASTGAAAAAAGSNSKSGYGGRPSWSGGVGSMSMSTNNLNNTNGGVSRPELQRSFSSGRKFGAGARHSTGGIRRSSLESSPGVSSSQGGGGGGGATTGSVVGSVASMYQNRLRPVHPPPSADDSASEAHEKEAYGAIIETPKKSSVSSLHAMFDSQNAVPLMPMNSTNARVRQSLPPGTPTTPTPITVRSSSMSSLTSSSPRVGGGGQRYRAGGSWNSNSNNNNNNNSSPSKLERKLQPHQQHRKSYGDEISTISSNTGGFSNNSQTQPQTQSRVRSYYNSSWRVETDKNDGGEDASKEGAEPPSTATASTATATTASASATSGSVVSSWQQRSKPRRIDAAAAAAAEEPESVAETKAEQPPPPNSSDEPKPNANARASAAAAAAAATVGVSSASVVSMMYSSSQPTKKKPTSSSQDEPKKVVAEPTDVSSSSVVAMMYSSSSSQNNKKKDRSSEDKQQQQQQPKQRAEPNDVSSLSVVSMMYSQNPKKIKEDPPAPAPAPPKRAEPKDVSSSAIAAMMYSQKESREAKLTEAALERLGESHDQRQAQQQQQQQHSEVDETATDVVQNMLLDDIEREDVVPPPEPSEVDETATDVVQNMLLDDIEREDVVPPPEPSEVDETATDVVQNMLLDDIGGEDFEMAHVEVEQPPPPPPPRSASRSIGPSSLSLNNNKPWESDAKNSVLQSWQKRSLQARSSSRSPSPSTAAIDPTIHGAAAVAAATATADAAAAAAAVQPSEPDASSNKEIEDFTGKGSVVVPDDEDASAGETLSMNSYSDIIEEKKSGDLSIDEDKILGEDSHNKHLLPGDDPANENTQPKNIPFYDDDSYISRGGDTASRALGASESFKSLSLMSRTDGTFNSEEISVYVEDERIISKKEDKILSAQFEQMHLEVAVGGDVGSNTEGEGPGTKPALSISTTPKAGTTNLPRLNPSPRDNDHYRIRYFEDTGAPATTPKSLRRNLEAKKTAEPDFESIQSKRSTENQVFDIWATSSASNDERDEAINFDQTDEWLDRDPDIEDASVASDADPTEKGMVEPIPPEPIQPEPRPVIIKKPPQSLRSLEKEMQRAKATNVARKPKKPPPQQEVFDPFGIDGEEADGLTIETSGDLFSQNPDPFTAEESFSPLNWSNGDPQSNSQRQQQHIGYYNSPDSNKEI